MKIGHAAEHASLDVDLSSCFTFVKRPAMSSSSANIKNSPLSPHHFIGIFLSSIYLFRARQTLFGMIELISWLPQAAAEYVIF
jgi:hypothetical protein